MEAFTQRLTLTPECFPASSGELRPSVLANEGFRKDSGRRTR